MYFLQIYCVFLDWNFKKDVDLETSGVLLGNKTCFLGAEGKLHKSVTKSYIGLNMCKSLCHKLSEPPAVHT